MMLAQVIGSVVATMKHGCYANVTLLLVKQVSPQLEPQKGVLAAVDLVGAGKGDIVLVASEGRAAEELMQFPCRMPVRSVIVGIVDSVDFDGGDV
ncbi:EutN/CcmL family microcompartment protein [candidate division KSB1 bacterium]|nr:EutN/CcmL family microcompartment protein [candidate division KSB1 bacterium]